jgi:hypothetical protein
MTACLPPLALFPPSLDSNARSAWGKFVIGGGVAYVAGLVASLGWTFARSLLALDSTS